MLMNSWRVSAKANKWNWLVSHMHSNTHTHTHIYERVLAALHAQTIKPTWNSVHPLNDPCLVAWPFNKQDKICTHSHRHTQTHINTHTHAHSHIRHCVRVCEHSKYVFYAFCMWLAQHFRNKWERQRKRESLLCCPLIRQYALDCVIIIKPGKCIATERAHTHGHAPTHRPVAPFL